MTIKKMLKIITLPNPLLRKKAKPVKDVQDPAIQKLIKAMALTMQKKDGVGLAAIQVGELKRIITVQLKDSVLILINPEITSRSLKKEIDAEGCLSVPGQFGPVKRSYKIKVKGLNSEGKKLKLMAEGLLARVIQHECDHLEGILFIDKLEKEGMKL